VTATGLLVAHGSPDPRHATALRHLQTAVASQLSVATDEVTSDLAFLEYDEPLLTSWLAARTTGRVRAIGLLLASGYHAQVDIPKALDAASPGLNVTNLGTLGLDTWLFEVLEQRVADAGGTLESPVVVVSAGSTQRAARDDLQSVCDMWQRRRSAAVYPAAVTGPDPRPDHVVATGDVAASDVVVVPFMLAPGALADRARVAAEAVGARCTDTITTEQQTPEELVTHLVDRLTKQG
jgi:sirohydrochlorin ferrochelatase